MKSNLFALSVLLLSALVFTTSCKDEDKEKPVLPETLTVQEIILGDRLVFKSIKVTNTQGNDIVFSDNPNYWFENAILKSMIIPSGAVLSFDVNSTGGLVMKLASWARCDFEVEGTSFLIGVGAGSKFVVQKTKTGKYNLLPNETVQLSPAP